MIGGIRYIKLEKSFLINKQVHMLMNIVKKLYLASLLLTLSCGTKSKGVILGETDLNKKDTTSCTSSQNGGFVFSLGESKTHQYTIDLRSKQTGTLKYNGTKLPNSIFHYWSPVQNFFKLGELELITQEKKLQFNTHHITLSAPLGEGFIVQSKVSYQRATSSLLTIHSGDDFNYYLATDPTQYSQHAFQKNGRFLDMTIKNRLNNKHSSSKLNLNNKNQLSVDSNTFTIINIPLSDICSQCNTKLDLNHSKVAGSCEYCYKSFTFCEQYKGLPNIHLSECKELVTKCSLCDKKMKNKDLASHQTEYFVQTKSVFGYMCSELFNKIKTTKRQKNIGLPKINLSKLQVNNKGNMDIINKGNIKIVNSGSMNIINYGNASLENTNRKSIKLDLDDDFCKKCGDPVGTFDPLHIKKTEVCEHCNSTAFSICEKRRCIDKVHKNICLREKIDCELCNQEKVMRGKILNHQQEVSICLTQSFYSYFNDNYSYACQNSINP